MKTLIILILIYIAYRVLKRVFYFKVIHHPHHPGGQQNPGPGTADEEMVQDPVCGSYVPIHTAVSANAGGRVVHFCSTECRDKFLESNS